MNLYDPFIERDLAAIPAAVAGYRANHTAEQTWTEVTRFAVLAFAPSQHAKHALLACLSTWDLRDELGAGFDDAIAACAVYAAASRQPWSEPPMLDPPRIGDDQRGDLVELREAIATSDRLRAERWLAKRFRDDDFNADFFVAASDDFGDLGHKLIIANAAVRLAGLLGDKGRYAMLRVGIFEMVSLGSGEPARGGGSEALDLESLCAGLLSTVVASGGEVISAHSLFLFDAALQTEDDGVISRVAEHLSDLRKDPGSASAPHSRIATPGAYAFARDYGSCLQAHAVAKRLRPRFPSGDFDGMLAAVHRNLETAPSLEGMTFA